MSHMLNSRTNSLIESFASTRSDPVSSCSSRRSTSDRRRGASARPAHRHAGHPTSLAKRFSPIHKPRHSASHTRVAAHPAPSTIAAAWRFARDTLLRQVVQGGRARMLEPVLGPCP